MKTLKFFEPYLKARELETDSEAASYMSFDLNNQIIYEDGRKQDLNLNQIYPEGFYVIDSLLDNITEIIPLVNEEWVNNYRKEYENSEFKKENDEYNKNERYKWRYGFEEMVATEIEDMIKGILHDSKRIGEIGIYGTKIYKYKDGSLIFSSDEGFSLGILFSKHLVES